MVTQGDEIKAAREALGLSQKDLANKVGTTQQTIEKLEKNKVRFSRYLEKICIELGLQLKGNVAESQPDAGTAPHFGKRDLPVFAVIDRDGVFVVSREPVDYDFRPAPGRNRRAAPGG